MTRLRNRRGSVLLLAIGMLTIIAIMASTFLIVSSLDAQESQTLAVKAQAEPLALGAIAMVMDQCGADRYVNSNGPYGGCASGSAGWRQYADYGGKSVDRWLSAEYDRRRKIGRHVTDLGADPASGGYDFPEDDSTDPQYSVFTTEVSGGAIEQGGFRYADTDGDNIPDARLYDTGVSDPSDPNTNFWLAVRVVDLKSRISINTAGGRRADDESKVAPTWFTPAMIDLYSFVGQEAYKRLHLGGVSDTAGKPLYGRVGPTGDLDQYEKSLRGYYHNCGSKLLGPAPTSMVGGQPYSAYAPFAMGDEVFLLMCSRYTQGSGRYSGRVHGLLKGSQSGPVKLAMLGDSAMPPDAGVAVGEDDIRRCLTTVSSVSSRVRRPQGSDDYLATVDTVTNDYEARRVFRRAFRMLGELGVGTSGAVRAKMAAHFAANLWAYQANGQAGAPWGLSINEGGYNFTVYGAQQDLVITEAFARHQANTDKSDDENKRNHASGYAVELSNPSKRTVNLGDYKLVVRVNGAIEDEISLAGAFGSALQSDLPPKVVVYSFVTGKASAFASKPETFFAVAPDATWQLQDKLDFSSHGKGINAKTVIELHGRANGSSPFVPLDRIAPQEEFNYKLNSRDDLGAKNPDLQGAPDTVTQDFRRDDRLKTSTGRRLARFNIAAYQVFSTSALGKPNGVLDDVFGTTSASTVPANAKAVFSAPIWRPREVAVQAGDQAALQDPNALDPFRMGSVGDLRNIHFAGPIVEGSEAEGFPQRILKTGDSALLRDGPERGRLPLLGTANSTLLQPPFTVADTFDGKSNQYPDVPSGAFFGEYFTRLFGDANRPGVVPRIHGQLNVNTAERDVLLRLPWPRPEDNTLGLGQTILTSFYAEDAVNFILAYRDRTQMSRAKDPTQGPSPNYRIRAGYGLTGLRADAQSNIRGFLTPGEVAVPLGDYMDYLLGVRDKNGVVVKPENRRDADYARARNSLYAMVADCLTTRSDTYAVYVHTQYGKAVPPRYKWRYLAIIDRSGVIYPQDLPALLLFAQMP